MELADSNSVRTIDISSWVGASFSTATTTSSVSPVHVQLSVEQLAVAKQWDEAMREIGCVVVVGHGIADDTFVQLNKECKVFFNTALSEKQKFNHGAYGHPLGGYTAPGNEIVALSCEEDSVSTALKQEVTAAMSKKFDPVENFVFTSRPRDFITPAAAAAGGGITSFSATTVDATTIGATDCYDDSTRRSNQPIASADAYYVQMEALLSTLHRISSAALQLSDVNFFEKFYDTSSPDNEGRSCGNNGNALRLAYYPALRELCDSSNISYALSTPNTNINNDNNISSNSNSDSNGNNNISNINSSNNSSSSSSSGTSSGKFDWSIRYGAHTDYQGFTILYPDASDWQMVSISDASSGTTITQRCGGLQVFHPRSQQWLPVQVPVPINSSSSCSSGGSIDSGGSNSSSGLVVNAGDLIQRWTNDRWHSPLHRVVCSPPAAAVVSSSSSHSSDSEAHTGSSGSVADFISRQAIVFFTGPIESCIIEVLDSCRGGEEVDLKYPPIRSGDHLLMKLNRTNKSST